MKQPTAKAERLCRCCCSDKPAKRRLLKKSLRRAVRREEPQAVAETNEPFYSDCDLGTCEHCEPDRDVFDAWRGSVS